MVEATEVMGVTMDNPPGTNQQTTVIQDNTGLLNRYLSNEHIDEETRKKHPETYDDALVLSFVDEKAIHLIEITRRQIERSERRKLPGHNFDTDARLEHLRNRQHLLYRIYRGKDGKERIAQNTQISHNVVGPQAQDTVHSAGYLSTLPIIGKYFK